MNRALQPILNDQAFLRALGRQVAKRIICSFMAGVLLGVGLAWWLL